MIRTVLDTNVFISAALSPKGVAAKILLLERQGRLELIFSPQTVKEYWQVLRRPKIQSLFKKHKIPFNTVEEFLKNLIQVSILTSGKVVIEAIKEDPSYNLFLACAIEGKADVIVSGDKHLRRLNKFKGIPIMNPARFLKKVSLSE